MARTDTLPHFLSDVADAIRTKTGTSDPIQASTFDTTISNIPSGDDSWKRPNDWWDTETILANAENKIDSEGVTVYPAYIILLADWDIETTFSASTSNAALRGDGYLTSDGAWYGTPEATHTWDITKDKPCDKGYNTRYVIVYAKNSINATINMRNFPCLEVILGNFQFYQNTVAFGSTSAPINTYIQNFATTKNTTTNGNWTISEYYGFEGCSELRNVYIPLTTVTSLYSHPFRNCYSLENVYLPYITSSSGNYNFNYCRSLKELSLLSVSSINSTMFAQTYSLKKLELGITTFNINLSGMFNLEELNLPNLVTFSTSNAFAEIPKLEKLVIPNTCTTFPTKSGSNPLFSKWIKNLELYEDFAINNVNLTNDIGLTHSCLVDILSKLKDVSGESDTYTLTIGSTNLAKLSADEIAIGTAKGWTIN